MTTWRSFLGQVHFLKNPLKCRLVAEGIEAIVDFAVQESARVLSISLLDSRERLFSISQRKESGNIALLPYVTVS